MMGLAGRGLEFDVDAVLRGQGANPAVLRARRPGLVRLAERAMQEGQPLIDPRIVHRDFAVQSVRHNHLELEGGARLRGKLVVHELAQARRIHVLLCTIGTGIEDQVSVAWKSNPAYGLALDGVGSAAVEALANQVCRSLELLEQAHGWQTTIPLSPGMADWTVEQGQPDIFRLLEREELPVVLSPNYLMQPRKSLTMVIGAGPETSSTGRTCDYCSLRNVCRYQDHYV